MRFSRVVGKKCGRLLCEFEAQAEDITAKVLELEQKMPISEVYKKRNLIKLINWYVALRATRFGYVGKRENFIA